MTARVSFRIFLQGKTLAEHSLVENSIDEGTTVAAVDLGSNSFHLIVARFAGGHLQIIDRLREMVRLAGGLDERNNLSDEAAERALACLERFGQRLRGLAPGTIRAVGTNTLRKARNSAGFLSAAARALGYPIEVIAGREEARLIYLGVSHSLPDMDGCRLVVDIGGGSTELIVGRHFVPIEMESLHMGCVSASRAFFPRGDIGEAEFKKAVIAARLELEPVAAGFRRLGWKEAVGASGTVRAVAQVAQAHGWSEGDLSRHALDQVVRAVISSGHVSQLQLPGLNEERREVFAGGVAVLAAVFESLGIERMTVSDWALREGLLHDLLGRIRHEDVRERTVASLSRTYHIDAAQAERVEKTAADALAQVNDAWGLSDPKAAELLHWSSRLHEIGLAVSHSGYHKHGAYLLANADMPGFSREEQRQLALLVRAHRRKFPAAALKEFPKGQSQCLARLAMLLRFSVLLHRSRTDAPLPTVAFHPEPKGVTLVFPADWLKAHPLTLADLQREQDLIRAGGLRLSFS